MFKCALATLGCKVNQCETQALAEMMKENGYTVVDFEEWADVYIINTCCVTAEGERKSRQLVRRAAAKNPDAVIAVTGCAVQKTPELFSAIPGVSVVVGNTQKQNLPAMILNGLKGCSVEDMAHFSAYQELPDSLGEKTRAFIKIQDGCNNFCTYCIIPYVRGRERSRRLERIEEQCKKLAAAGFCEIVLNGIHLSSYGREWKFSVNLADVVERVAAIDGIERVRLGSLEPNIITDAFLARVCAREEFCRQYHLSLQSGSDTVLKRMNRRYTAEEYFQAVEKIRKIDPLSAISTDIITGFPGETEEEFRQTLAFAEKVGFAWVHVFPYSAREGTRAAAMEGHLPKSVKAARAAQLSTLCEQKSREYRRQFIGMTKSVLCENASGGRQYGLTKEHLQVSFPGEGLSGKIVFVKITQLSEYGLLGERI